MKTTRKELADLFENTGHFMDCRSSDGYSRHQMNFRIDGRVIQKALEGTQNKNTQEINQGIWNATTPNTSVWKCFVKMVYVDTFHNKVAPGPDETTRGVEQARGHR